MPTNFEVPSGTAPALESLEAIRLEYLGQYDRRQRWLYASIGILFLAIGAVGFLLYQGQEVPVQQWVFLGGGVVFLIVTAVMVGQTKSKFRKDFKAQAYRQLVETLQPGMTYRPKGQVAASAFRNAQLFGAFDRYRGEDYFTGPTQEGCTVEFSELDVEEEYQSTDSDGDTTTNYRTIFKGLFFVLHTPRTGHRNIRILPDVAERGIGVLGKMLQKSIGSFFQRGSMVYFEDHPEFEKLFVVYSDDEQDAKAVLTLPVLEVIYDLKYQWNGGIQLSFIDDKIYLALSTKRDLFTVDLHQPVKGNQFLSKLNGELEHCFKMVDHLSLIYTTSQHNKTEMSPQNPFNAPKSGVSYRKSSSNDNPFLL